MKKVTVIGCGVIGLTTAIHLEKAGYEVRIITNKLHFRTTSAIAAAIWMPFKAEPAELVNRWSLETYFTFKATHVLFWIHTPTRGYQIGIMEGDQAILVTLCNWGRFGSALLPSHFSSS